jgi:hypothetical protein
MIALRHGPRQETKSHSRDCGLNVLPFLDTLARLGAAHRSIVDDAMRLKNFRNNGSTQKPALTSLEHQALIHWIYVHIFDVAVARGAIPFDPANNRVFGQFADPTSTVRGQPSVAVRTQ